MTMFQYAVAAVRPWSKKRAPMRWGPGFINSWMQCEEDAGSP
jgi:hypothetical protein